MCQGYESRRVGSAVKIVELSGSLVPRPPSSFLSLAVWKSGESVVCFLT